MNNQGPKNIRGGCAAQTLGHPSNAMVSFNTPALMILVYLKGGKERGSQKRNCPRWYRCGAYLSTVVQKVTAVTTFGVAVCRGGIAELIMRRDIGLATGICVRNIV